ncbi:hypothetical protein BGX26_005853 [Mortierella sp. AD094]|nr:hypothetical protein BGX26_005853 [Mortierella sp. AD094]
MSRNPYFSHLPTWRNRQDLAFALDSLPHILASFTSTSSLPSRVYPSPPSSPICSSTSFSHSHSHSHSRPTLSIRQQHYQQCLVEQHLCNDYPWRSQSDMLQFSTRAQAMAFLIDILRSMQSEPCECDLVQGCFCSPDGTVEDHSGMAPCYVCGEWYAEQVYCRDEETMELYQVDGRSWHERGASLRHHVEEARVRRWLDQVVVPPPPQYAPLQRSDTMPTTTTTVPPPQRQPLKRSASAPASFLIPKEILDPSCRQPGFRIKSKDAPSTTPICNNANQEKEEVSSSSSSIFGSSFSFTSERFRTAIQQQSTLEKPSVPSMPSAANDAIIKTSLPPSPLSRAYSVTNNSTTEQVVDSCPSSSSAAAAAAAPTAAAPTAADEPMNDVTINQAAGSLAGTEASADYESPTCAIVTPEQKESNSLMHQPLPRGESQFDFNSANRTSLEGSSDSPLLEAEHTPKTLPFGQVSAQISHASSTLSDTSASTTISSSSYGTLRSTSGAVPLLAPWPLPSISAATWRRTLQRVITTASSLSSFHRHRHPHPRHLHHHLPRIHGSHGVSRLAV